MRISEQIQFLLDFFGVTQVWDIPWAHAVNGQSGLNRLSRSNGSMMIEGDISISSEGEIIMAYPPDTSSDLKYEDWLGRIIDSRKGAKLDFKYPEVVSQCLEKLQELKPQIPIFLNADILEGPGGMPPIFNTNSFINECLKYYPNAIISLGWTTEFISEGEYTETMLIKMADVVQNLGTKQTITVCIRACYLKSIPQTYHDVFRQSPNTFTTLWNAKEDPPPFYGLKEHVEKSIGLDKVFYDLIDKEGNPVSI